MKKEKILPGYLLCLFLASCVSPMSDDTREESVPSVTDQTPCESPWEKSSFSHISFFPDSISNSVKVETNFCDLYTSESPEEHLFAAGRTLILQDGFQFGGCGPTPSFALSVSQPDISLEIDYAKSTTSTTKGLCVIMSATIRFTLQNLPAGQYQMRINNKMLERTFDETVLFQ